MNMTQQTLETFLIYVVMYTFAFEDLIYVNGQGNQEMIEHGRVQYQLLKERGNLPQYGPCWKSAVGHLDEGCKHLSEETQSDIALHVTNCFLEMSGHETYNCELDKKPNLRAICINSMSDRAFNVYTEFYTHTQNICWFLRGQIWQETIVENTHKVGKQLEVTAQNQEGLLQAQKESLELQEKMLKHGKFLEQVLEDLYISSKAHQEILHVLSQSVSNLQSWVVGEISWIDSIMFYAVTIILTFVLTSTQQTISARLPIFILMFLNLVIERFICSFILSRSDESNTQILYSSIYDIVWYSRYTFALVSILVFIYQAIFHRDLATTNYKLLNIIRLQNSDILEKLENLNSSSNIDKVNFKVSNESSVRNTPEYKVNKFKKEYIDTYGEISSSNGIINNNYTRLYSSPSPRGSRESSVGLLKENTLNNSNGNSERKKLFPLSELQNFRYNLRNRSCTPD